MRPALFRIWFQLLRPWSLTASIVPFALVMPFADDPFAPLRLSFALAAAVFLQTACNLLNTWGDWKSGLDARADAKASVPLLVQGAVSPRAVLAAAVAALAGAAACAAPLVFCGPDGGRFNFPLLAIALAGFAGACNYATMLRFKYRGLGVPFVFVLMGPLFFAGAYIAAEPYSPEGLAGCLVASLPVSCHVAAILHGNDMRDRCSDGAAGIKTAAVRFGPRGAAALYAVLLLAPFAMALSAAAAFLSAPFLLPFAAFPKAVKSVRRAYRLVAENPAAPQWVRFERDAGAVHFIYGIMLAAALALFRA